MPIIGDWLRQQSGPARTSGQLICSPKAGAATSDAAPPKAIRRLMAPEFFSPRCIAFTLHLCLGQKFSVTAHGVTGAK